MNIIEPESITELGAILTKSGINLSEYGNGKAKDLDDLFTEVQNGESTLTLDPETQKIIRTVSVVNADILYTHPLKGELELFEQIQVFKIKIGENLRYRVRNLPAAMMEKYKNDESSVNAMLRGMKEELGIDIHHNQYNENIQKSREEEIESPSFPGIRSIYKISFFEIMLNDEQFNPWGYFENQEKKCTSFKWREKN